MQRWIKSWPANGELPDLAFNIIQDLFCLKEELFHFWKILPVIDQSNEKSTEQKSGNVLKNHRSTLL